MRSVYAVCRPIGHYTATANFWVNGELRDLSFTESFNFSIIASSTVGFGDLVPLGPPVRPIVGREIVCGVLRLFGLCEIITYSREHTRRRD
jgi:voltage-gated potassium channel